MVIAVCSIRITCLISETKLKMKFFSAFSITFLYFVNFSYAQFSHYETKSFTVPLDHFSKSGEPKTTFAIRYLINDTFWMPNCGPILFYTGNEAPIEEYAEATGFLWEAAIKLKGLVVFAEHRYYGSSQPFKNMGEQEPPEHLAYLSSAQALADFVDLINELRTNYQKAGSQPKVDKSKISNAVISIGGSYGGMLAAWIRMKYPKVVEGALASSAPMFITKNTIPCNSYTKIMTDVYRNIGGSTCVDNIRRSWDYLTNRVDDQTLISFMDSWNFCKPPDTDEDYDIFYNKLYLTYQLACQYNYPYPSKFSRIPLPANPVKVICSHFSNPSSSDTDLLKAVHDAISPYYLDEKTKCFKWENSDNPIQRLDNYFYDVQACKEFVSPYCRGESEIFLPSSWNFTEYSEDCEKKYKVKANEKYIEEEYGDLSQASNIIFSNGLYDPWSGRGVLDSKGLPPSITVQVIPDAGHHLDLFADNAADPPSVKDARKKYIKIFCDWITNFLKQNNIVDDEYLKYLSTVS